MNGWAYQLGSWKEQAFVPTLDDMKAAEPAKKPAEGAAARAGCAGRDRHWQDDHALR